MSKIFSEGGQLPPPKKGILMSEMVAHVKVCLPSFEPSHEHKLAGIGYLLSLWCVSPPGRKKPGHPEGGIE